MEILNNKGEFKLPTHTDFCDLMKIFRKDKPPLHKWLSYPAYIIFKGFIGTIIAVMQMSSESSRERSYYPSDKYKKVVKEGILWDSIEWHER